MTKYFVVLWAIKKGQNEWEKFVGLLQLWTKVSDPVEEGFLGPMQREKTGNYDCFWESQMYRLAFPETQHSK